MHIAFQFKKWKRGDNFGVIGVDGRLKSLGNYRGY
jgi:hypothetical protein